MYGRMFAAARAAGQSSRARLTDLLIASTAAAHELPLYTRNPSDFAALKRIVKVVARWLALQLQFHADAAPLEFVVHEVDDFLDELIEVERRLHRRGFLEQRSYACDDDGRPVHVLNDVRNGRAGLVEERRVL